MNGFHPVRRFWTIRVPDHNVVTPGQLNDRALEKEAVYLASKFNW